ncbi:MAG TPA: dTMP kinase [Chloroflexota bacterium]
MRGRFIVLEGLDGAGISTQARRLAGRLDHETVSYYATREPTDGPIGSQIRLALTGRLELDPTTIALMFAADRSDQIRAVVLPRLEAGVHVLSERHVLSSLAYQGAQLGDPAWVREINRENMRALTPDLTIFLDVPPDMALRRIDAGRHARELFEQRDTLASTRAAFMDAIDAVRAAGARVEILDAAGPIAEIEEEIARLVLPLIQSGARSG